MAEAKSPNTNCSSIAMLTESIIKFKIIQEALNETLLHLDSVAMNAVLTTDKSVESLLLEELGRVEIVDNRTNWRQYEEQYAEMKTEMTRMLAERSPLRRAVKAGDVDHRLSEILSDCPVEDLRTHEFKKMSNGVFLFATEDEYLLPDRFGRWYNHLTDHLTSHLIP